MSASKDRVEADVALAAARENPRRRIYVSNPALAEMTAEELEEIYWLYVGHLSAEDAGWSPVTVQLARKHDNAVFNGLLAGNWPVWRASLYVVCLRLSGEKHPCQACMDSHLQRPKPKGGIAGALKKISAPIQTAVSQAKDAVQDARDQTIANVKGSVRAVQNPEAAVRHTVDKTASNVKTAKDQAVANVKGIGRAIEDPIGAADRLRHRITAEARRLPAYDELKKIEQVARPGLQFIGQWAGPVVAAIVTAVPGVGPIVAAAVTAIDMLLKTAYAGEVARRNEARALEDLREALLAGRTLEDLLNEPPADQSAVDPDLLSQLAEAGRKLEEFTRQLWEQQSPLWKAWDSVPDPVQVPLETAFWAVRDFFFAGRDPAYPAAGD